MKHRPREQKQPTGKRIDLMSTSAKIFRAIQEHPNIDTNHLVDLLELQMSESWVKRCLKDYFHEKHKEYGHLLDRPKEQYIHGNKAFRPVLHNLNANSEKYLEDIGYPQLLRHPRSPSFKHIVLENRIAAAFRIACQRSSAHRFLSPEFLIDRFTLPAEKSVPEMPFRFDVTINTEEGPLPTTVTPDWRGIFGIQYLQHSICVALEADCATERNETKKYKNVRSIKKLFMQWIKVFDEQLYRKQLGFPNLFVTIVTTNATKKQNMMEVLRNLTEGEGKKYFLFKAVESFTDYFNSPLPNPQMFHEPWDRVGHEPFYLSTLSETPPELSLHEQYQRLKTHGRELEGV